MKYRIRPAEIEAYLFTGLECDVPKWASKAIVSIFQGATMATMTILTKRGLVTAWENQDYIVHYPDGSVDVIKRDVFEDMFEVVSK